MEMLTAWTEEEKLFQDRVERFEAMGYRYTDALDLALMDVDWRVVKGLIDQGCSHELARRIAE